MEWTSEPHKAAMPETKKEKLSSVSVSTWANVETINKMNRHKADLAAR